MARFNVPDGSNVHVYFDQSPVTVLGSASRYQELLAAHTGPVGAARRPDVIVERRTGDESIVLLVDAKETVDKGYSADSLYKAMGYVHDFRSLWAVGPSKPNVLLIFPEHHAPKPSADLSDLEVVMAYGFDRATIAGTIKRRLGFATS